MIPDVKIAKLHSLSCYCKMAIHKIILLEKIVFLILFLSSLQAVNVRFLAPKRHCQCVVSVYLLLIV